MPTIYVFGIIHMYLDVSGSHGDDDKSQWLMNFYQLFLDAYWACKLLCWVIFCYQNSKVELQN